MSARRKSIHDRDCEDVCDVVVQLGDPPAFEATQVVTEMWRPDENATSKSVAIGARKSPGRGSQKWGFKSRDSNAEAQRAQSGPCCEAEPM